MHYAGELAALGTALCWTFGSQLFEAAGLRAGSMAVNLLRLVLALVFFCIVSLFVRGSLIPLDFPVHAWVWLGLSGFIGFALGDLFLFQAFVEIGPRLSMLVMTLTAPISAILGLIFLGEVYTPLQWLAMAVTLSGVAWVILERSGQGNGRRRKVRVITFTGVLYAFLGTVGQAVGYILSKYGMWIGDHFIEPFAATQIRIISGIIGFMVIVTIRGSWGKVAAAVANKAALGFMTAGAFVGPFLGVSLSLLALHYTTAGVATTITALVPIFLIPSVIVIGREHVSLRAFLGAVVAVGGVILLLV
ncbi:MAG: DMT family transporter [Candidatus Neomarinimicrobiota bacterium]